MARVNYTLAQVMTPNRKDKDEQPASSGEARYRKHFERLLQRRGDPEAAVLEAGDLWPVLQRLGMATEVSEDELCDMLKSSGYADETGALDFEQFIKFAKDFKLLESNHVYMRERKKGNYSDRGPLGELFEILDVGEETGFSSLDFIQALGRVDTEITEETADSLVRYANLHIGVKINFQQFVRVLRKERQKYLQGQDN